MNSPAEMYIMGVKAKLLNHYAAWLPNEPLELGDVGVLDKKLFTRVTSLGDLNIPFEIREDPNFTPLDIVSHSDVSMVFKAAGAVNPKLPSIPEAKAGIGVEFGKKGAFVVKAEQSFAPSIENIAQVQEKVLQAYRDGSWNPKWAVIIKLVKTPKASIIISNSSSAKIELEAEGAAESASLDLGDAELKFSITAQKGDLIKLIGAENISPFFQLAGVKKKLFREPTVDIRALTLPSSHLDMLAPNDVGRDHDKESLLYLDLISDADDW